MLANNMKRALLGILGIVILLFVIGSITTDWWDKTADNDSKTTEQYELKTMSSLFYDGREITVNVELLSSQESENKKIQITAFDNTNNEVIQNVTYLLSISKANENLLREYFFAEDGILIANVQPDNESPIKVIGEKQYDHYAYVMPGTKYSPVQSGANLTSITPIQIIGPLFNTEGIYIFDIELRTIDSSNNWVFDLSGFHSQVTIGN
jgi:hypothetical protein